ncbi:hypothetical protein VARIO8X_150145 [Burkholderiales bacterium 8X]|nr:hypothetical protein VARIO8X_150145 [Burkholderiales bacterium 8X]
MHCSSSFELTRRFDRFPEAVVRVSFRASGIHSPARDVSRKFAVLEPSNADEFLRANRAQFIARHHPQP